MSSSVEDQAGAADFEPQPALQQQESCGLDGDRSQIHPEAAEVKTEFAVVKQEPGAGLKADEPPIPLGPAVTSQQYSQGCPPYILSSLFSLHATESTSYSYSQHASC